MYKKQKPKTTLIKQNYILEGETLEEKLRRIIENGEPISDGSPTIYTERKDGVLPEYNPRTDRFDVAIDAMDKVSKSHLAKRKANMKPVEGGQLDKNKGKNDGGAEPIQGTSEPSN